MPNLDPQRLSGLDAVILGIERPGLPMQVGSVGIFDAAGLVDDTGELRLAELRDLVCSRLDSLPRLRAKLTYPAGAIDRPWWVEDPDFDIARHVDTVDLGGDADDRQLKDAVGRILAEPLDREHSLWNLRFLTGLRGGRIALVERAHHALVDGVSGVDVATTLFDLEPREATPPPGDWRPAPLPDPGQLATEALKARVTEPLDWARSVVSTLGHPLRVLGATIDVGTAAGTALAEGLIAPRSSLNDPTGPERHVEWISTSFDAVHRTGVQHHCTVNDVVLSAIAAGLRSRALHRGEPLPASATVKVLVPVAVRQLDGHGALGNHLSGLLLTLPIGVGDPERRLRLVAESTRRLKDRREAPAIELLAETTNLLPPLVLQALGRLSDQQRFVNLVVTNVPGPGAPLYVLGSRLREAVPFVPLAGNLSTGVAVLSYDGRLSLGFQTDAEHADDLEAFVRGVQAALPDDPDDAPGHRGRSALSAAAPARHRGR